MKKIAFIILFPIGLFAQISEEKINTSWFQFSNDSYVFDAVYIEGDVFCGLFSSHNSNCDFIGHTSVITDDCEWWSKTNVIEDEIMFNYLE